MREHQHIWPKFWANTSLMLLLFLGIHSSVQAAYKVILKDGTAVAAQSKPVSIGSNLYV
jgi:hypothetical protein